MQVGDAVTVRERRRSRRSLATEGRPLGHQKIQPQLGCPENPSRQCRLPWPRPAPGGSRASAGRPGGFLRRREKPLLVVGSFAQLAILDLLRKTVGDLLSQEACNGNPVAIALDRICPPSGASQDAVAKGIREVGRARFGCDSRINAWSPAFEDYRLTA